MTTDPAPIPAALDLQDTLELGQAMYRFLARTAPEAQYDEFTYEDAGVSISAGFIEIDPDLVARVREIIEAEDAKSALPSAL